MRISVWTYRPMISLMIPLMVSCGSLQMLGDNEQVECFAGGHGPYSETQSSCKTQAERQVYVNCVLAGQDAEIVYEMRFFVQKKIEQGVCTARFDQAKKDCFAMACFPTGIQSHSL